MKRFPTWLQVRVALLLLWLIALLVVGCDAAEAVPAQSVEPAKRQAFVHLQEGFDGSLITVTYNDTIVYQGSPQEDERLGFSDDFAFVIDTDATGLLSLTRADRPTETFEAVWSKGLKVGVGIQAGEVQFRHPGLFGYD